MKAKLIFLALLGAAVIWGCGKTKTPDEPPAADSTAAAPADTLHVISLPDLGMQSMKSSKDSTTKVWKENMTKLRGLDNLVRGSKKRIMSSCCPCADGTGCCLCTKDTTKHATVFKRTIALLAAPKEIRRVEFVSQSQPTNTIPLEQKEIDGLNVFAIKWGMTDGKYLLRVSGNEKDGAMDYEVEIRNNEIRLVPRK